MLGSRWDALIERFICAMPAGEETYFWFFTCSKHPEPHSTLEKYVWGSELISTRYFAFFVSDAACKFASAADFKPRRLYGWDMGPEWDAALGDYWRMSAHVSRVRRVSARLQREMPGRFPGPDPLLKFYDSKRSAEDEDEDEERPGPPKQKQKLKIILPPPPLTKPKRRRRPEDPEPGFDAWLARRRGLPPSLPPSLPSPAAANTSGGKVFTQPLESQALTTARALYRESTPEFFDDDDLDELVQDEQLSNEDESDSEDDAEYSDDDEYDEDSHEPCDEDENMRRAILLSKTEQADREQRRDSGGDDGGVGPAPKEEKKEDQTTDPPPPETNRIAGLPFPVLDSGKSPTPSMLMPPPPLPRPSSSMLPPPSPRPSSSMLPPPSPRLSSAALPQLPPPSPRPSPSQLMPPPPRPPPRPALPALPPVVPERRKRKFRVIDHDADPDLDGDSDSGDDEDVGMEDVVEGDHAG
jgi:hypothetical protein